MCLIEKREATILPLNMTLAARIYPQNACVEVGVPLNGWSTGVACCPNCRHELRVSLTSAASKCHVTPTPHTPPPFTIQPSYLPHSPLYATPSSPLFPTPYNEELKRLADTLSALRLSGWYYGNLDWQGARTLLKDASIGAFVIRDSGDRNFIFSLSVQTERGPTSVRLHYEQGFFRLDCDRPLARYMPRFRCVVELVQHYARAGAGAGTGAAARRALCVELLCVLATILRRNPELYLRHALDLDRLLDDAHNTFAKDSGLSESSSALSSAPPSVSVGYLARAVVNTVLQGAATDLVPSAQPSCLVS